MQKALALGQRFIARPIGWLYRALFGSFICYVALAFLMWMPRPDGKPLTGWNLGACIFLTLVFGLVAGFSFLVVWPGKQLKLWYDLKTGKRRFYLLRLTGFYNVRLNQYHFDYKPNSETDPMYEKVQALLMLEEDLSVNPYQIRNQRIRVFNVRDRQGDYCDDLSDQLHLNYKTSHVYVGTDHIVASCPLTHHDFNWWKTRVELPLGLEPHIRTGETYQFLKWEKR